LGDAIWLFLELGASEVLLEMATGDTMGSAVSTCIVAACRFISYLLTVSSTLIWYAPPPARADGGAHRLGCAKWTRMNCRRVAPLSLHYVGQTLDSEPFPGHYFGKDLPGSVVPCCLMSFATGCAWLFRGCRMRAVTFSVHFWAITHRPHRDAFSSSTCYTQA